MLNYTKILVKIQYIFHWNLLKSVKYTVINVLDFSDNSNYIYKSKMGIQGFFKRGGDFFDFPRLKFFRNTVGI